MGNWEWEIGNQLYPLNPLNPLPNFSLSITSVKSVKKSVAELLSCDIMLGKLEVAIAR